MKRERRLLEPKDRFDRVIYALLAVFGPGGVIISFKNPELRWAAAILAAWTLLAAFYTIEGLVLAYRRWRSR